MSKLLPLAVAGDLPSAKHNRKFRAHFLTIPSRVILIPAWGARLLLELPFLYFFLPGLLSGLLFSRPLKMEQPRVLSFHNCTGQSRP